MDSVLTVQTKINLESEFKWRAHGVSKKAMGLIIKTTTYKCNTFHYDVKIRNVTFYREYNQVNDEILFPFLNLNMVLRNSTPRDFAYI